MKKAFVALLLKFILLMSPAHALVGLKECGDYQINGVIRKNIEEHGYSVIVNEHTKSEYKFVISINDELKISPFIGSSIELTAKIIKSHTGFSSHLEKIFSVKKLTREELQSSRQEKITLLSKEPCIP
jgi:hypothetical protein